MNNFEFGEKMKARTKKVRGANCEVLQESAEDGRSTAVGKAGLAIGNFHRCQLSGRGEVPGRFCFQNANSS